MLNFILCDDNSTILERLHKMLESLFMKHNFDAEVSFYSTKPEEILDYIKSHPVNVVFLDIDLKSQISGLELAEKIRKKNKNIYIIFTTGHLEYGLLAYKYKTFDYLPKPITLERLEDTVVRLFEDISYSPKSFIKIDNKNTIISEEQINYIMKDGMKSIFYTDDKVVEVYNSFNKLESTLPVNFMRCHKSYIVNLNNITRVQSNNNLIFFGQNHHCYIGPKYKEKFMEVFNHYGTDLDSTDN